MSRLLSHMCGRMMRTHCASLQVWQHSMPISSQTELLHVPPRQAGEVSMQSQHNIACVCTMSSGLKHHKPQFASRILCRYKAGQMAAQKVNYGWSACVTAVPTLLVFYPIRRENTLSVIPYHALPFLFPHPRSCTFSFYTFLVTYTIQIIWPESGSWFGNIWT
jgi:hypothetical protein